MNIIQSMIHEKLGEVRIIKSEDGNPMHTLFCAVDVTRVLSYVDTHGAIRRHCKGVLGINTPTNGGNQNINFIYLPDVFRLINRSNKPEAVEFQDWINEDLLPNLYQFGNYNMDNHITNPEFFNPEYTDGDIKSAVQSVDLNHMTSFNLESGECVQIDHSNIVHDVVLIMKDMLTPMYNNQNIMYNQINEITNRVNSIDTTTKEIKQMIIPAIIVNK